MNERWQNVITKLSSLDARTYIISGLVLCFAVYLASTMFSGYIQPAAGAIDGAGAVVDGARAGIDRSADLNTAGTDSATEIGRSAGAIAGRIDSAERRATASAAGITSATAGNRQAEQNLSHASERIIRCIKLNKECQRAVEAGQRGNAGR